MKKALRLALAGLSVEYLYRCLICLHTMTRVYAANVPPPDTIACTLCGKQARRIES